MNRLAARLVLITVMGLLLGGDAEARRRAVVARGDVPDTPRAWLVRNAWPLETTTLQGSARDLEPLRALVGDADIVALGDGTHGTHEFFTVKARIIEFLAREMGFDLVAFEAPFPLFNRLNEYVQNGTGDPAALLDEGNSRLGYGFWDVREMLEIVEALRLYNLSRGSRPPLAVAGMDVYDTAGATQAVLAYLRTVDPAAAAEAQSKYGCVTPVPTFACAQMAEEVRAALAPRRSELSAASGEAAFDEALQNATVIVQASRHFSDRDRDMATNIGWLRERRSRAGKVAVWAHQEHVGRTKSVWVIGEPMGAHLDRAFGMEFTSIGTLSGAGTVLQWSKPTNTTPSRVVITEIPPPAADSYESIFKLGPSPALMIPLRKDPPAWLVGPRAYFTAGAVPASVATIDSLPAKLDAVIYIDRTTACTPLH